VLAPDAPSAGAAPAAAGRAPRIAARPAEYETATLHWVYQAIQAIMRASDPVYAQLRPELTDTAPRQRLDLGDGREIPVDPYTTSVHGSIETGPLIAGDLGALHAEILSLVGQQLEQTMRAWFAVMNDVTTQVGNAVDAHGDAAEGLLAALEKMDIAFDDNGDPALQIIVSPDNEARVRAQLETLTPAQQQRFAAIISSKREAYRATRRHRRLPRHGH
jgi:hypothetical protein